LVAPDIGVNPVVGLLDDCHAQVTPGLVVGPTLNRFALNEPQPTAGPASAIPDNGVPEQDGAPPFTNTA